MSLNTGSPSLLLKGDFFLPVYGLCCSPKLTFVCFLSNFDFLVPAALLDLSLSRYMIPPLFFVWGSSYMSISLFLFKLDEMYDLTFARILSGEGITAVVLKVLRFGTLPGMSLLEIPELSF